MLNEYEESRLVLCTTVTEKDVENKLKSSRLIPETVLWLAEKLKETNENLKEYEKMNE